MKILTASFFLFLFIQTNVFAAQRGIYINHSTLEKPKLLNELIEQSKMTGINTFVVDLNKITKNYQKSINLIKSNGIKYVARIVVFPDGGDVQQVRSKAHWEERYKLVDAAIKYGADEIQLDYIRYNTKRKPSHENAEDILNVIEWFKQKVSQRNIPLQIDVFGEASFRPSPRIGHNIKLFANAIDVVCPMVYPSHYAPVRYHSDRPYETIDKSLKAMKRQMNNNLPFKLRPYIEASNYKYKMSHAQRVDYIRAQLKAVEDNTADGWYVWSANNHYSALFQALKERGTKNSVANQQNDNAATRKEMHYNKSLN